MIELITEIIEGEPYSDYSLGKHIVRAPGVCGGRPTLKYTRIEISGTIDRLASGEDIESIVSGYRNRAAKEAVIEAIRLVTSHFEESLPELEAA